MACPALMSCSSTVWGLKVLEKRIPTPALVDNLWLRKNSPGHSFLQPPSLLLSLWVSWTKITSSFFSSHILKREALFAAARAPLMVPIFIFSVMEKKTKITEKYMIEKIEKRKQSFCSISAALALVTIFFFTFSVCRSLDHKKNSKSGYRSYKTIYIRKEQLRFNSSLTFAFHKEPPHFFNWVGSVLFLLRGRTLSLLFFIIEFLQHFLEFSWIYLQHVFHKDIIHVSIFIFNSINNVTVHLI